MCDLLQCRALRCSSKPSTPRRWTCLQKLSSATPKITGELTCEPRLQLRLQPFSSTLVDESLLLPVSACFFLCLRLYGNRSYCHWFLEQFSAALSDARRSIRFAPDWPKGYFRKGCALVGLKVSEFYITNNTFQCQAIVSLFLNVSAYKTLQHSIILFPPLLSLTAVVCLCKWQRYSEAEKALEKVLELDQNCKEASKKLFNCRVLQLMVRNVTSDFRVLGYNSCLEDILKTSNYKNISPTLKSIKHPKFLGTPVTVGA